MAQRKLACMVPPSRPSAHNWFWVEIVAKEEEERAVNTSQPRPAQTRSSKVRGEGFDKHWLEGEK